MLEAPFVLNLLGAWRPSFTVNGFVKVIRVNAPTPRSGNGQLACPFRRLVLLLLRHPAYNLPFTSEKNDISIRSPFSRQVSTGRVGEKGRRCTLYDRSANVEHASVNAVIFSSVVRNCL